MIGIGLPALTALAGCATAVYIRRDTFTNRWESSATINLILQAAGLILIHPYATPLIGAALRATTGSWHIDTWLGHCAYLAAAATILYSVATRLAPPDRVAAAFAPVPHLLTLAATAMFATITMSPHTAAADCPRDIFAIPPDAWLTSYWAMFCTVGGGLAVWVIRLLLILRTDPRSRRTAHWYLAGCVCGIAGCTAQAITLIIGHPLGWLVWLSASTSAAMFATASARSWRAKHAWFAPTRCRDCGKPACPQLTGGPPNA